MKPCRVPARLVFRAALVATALAGLATRVLAQVDHAVADRGSPTAARSRALLTVTETDRNGKEYPIYRRARAAVDVESTVEIAPDLTALIGPYGPLSVTSPVAEELNARTDALTLTLRVFVDSIGAYTAAIDAAQRRLARSPADASAQRTLRRSLAMHGRLVTGVMDALNVSDSAAMERVLGSPDPAYRSLQQVLRDRVEATRDELAAAARAALAGSRAYVVRLYAVRRSPGRSPVQVHLNGYDNLPSGDPRPIDRLSWARTPEEDATLQRSVQAYQSLASTINDARDNHRTLGESVRRLYGGAASEVRGMNALADSLPRATDVDAALKVVSASGLSPIAERLRAVKTALAPLEAARTGREKLDDAFAETSSPVIALDVLLARAAQLRDTIDSTSTIAKAVTGFAGAARAADSVAAALSLRGADADSLTKVRTGALTPWLGVADRLTARLGEAKRQLQEIKTLAEPLALLGGIAAARAPIDGGLQVDALTVSAEEARPTTLDLTTVDQRDGDRIVVTYRVLNREQTVTIASAEQTLEVRTFGMYRRWSGALAFTRTQRADGFRAGAAASYVLHYRGRPKLATGEISGGARTWNAIDPGLGLASVVTSGTSNVEVGFGPAVSVLRDLLQVGYGYNLQQQRWYLSLSTPLIDVVQRLAGSTDGTAVSVPETSH